jgi:hypothetical protein
MTKTGPQSVNLLFSPEEVEARERESELGSKAHQVVKMMNTAPQSVNLLFLAEEVIAFEESEEYPIFVDSPLRLLHAVSC